MKKLLLLILLICFLFSCDERNLKDLKGGIVVYKSISASDDGYLKPIKIRLNGELYYAYVTYYELSQYQLGDTIK